MMNFHRWEEILVIYQLQRNTNSNQKIRTALTLKLLYLRKRIKTKFNKLVINKKKLQQLNKKWKNLRVWLIKISRVCNNQNKTHQNKRKMSFQ